MNRTLLRDRKPLKYSLFVEKREREETDKEGNTIKTGEPVSVYSEPTDFKANLQMSGNNESNMAEYGIDMSDYDAILIVPKNNLPIVEGSLIWDESEPQKDTSGYVIKSSADYEVKKKKPTTNYDKYILARLVN